MTGAPEAIDGVVVPPMPPLPAPAVDPAVTPDSIDKSEAPVPSDGGAVQSPTVDAETVAAASVDVETVAAASVGTSSASEPRAEVQHGATLSAGSPTAVEETDIVTEVAVVDRVEVVPVDVVHDEVLPVEKAPGSADDQAVVDTDSAPVAPVVAPGPAVAVEADVPALRVRGVTKSFGDTRAVDGIDLTVPAGTFYGLVGPNGAGKTTTLSMIAGLLQPDRGEISVNGVDAGSRPRDAKRLMGVLPDRLRTFDRLTGRQLLYYCGVLRGLDSAVVESRAADLARAFDLADALGRPVSDYSAGMTKKVMLAGAMIHSPRLLVLDEPFEAVDPVSSSVILDILSAYVAHGGTVILSSHGMDLVERVCSRVAVIVAGQVLAEGTVDDVRGELTLEQRFIELAGGLSDVEGLEWLHTFSG
ncbi:ATP-binding cassette domain-containing protein [Microbacterium sp.]|uniref:ABC transporter ATP-binding protein n=1 Tax=Microbacterium sp. TaxID=51671 RepID=UPI003430DD89